MSVASSKSDRQQFVGDVLDINDGWLTIDVKNRFETGDLLELVTPSGNLSFDLSERSYWPRWAIVTDVAPGSGHVVKIPLPESADADTLSMTSPCWSAICRLRQFGLQHPLPPEEDK